MNKTTMNVLKRINEVIAIIVGLGAIIFSITSYFWKIPVTIDQSYLIIIGVAGLILTALTTLLLRLNESKDQKLVNHVSQQKLYDFKVEAPREYEAEISKASSYVNDIFTNWVTPRDEAVRYYKGRYSAYNLSLFHRVRKGQIIFSQIQIVYHQQGLEELIHRLLLHEGYDYFIRYYKIPNTIIPSLQITSFDDNVFFMGVGYPFGLPNNNKIIRSQDDKLRIIFMDYWTELWKDAIPLNEGRLINWKEISNIGISIGMNENEFSIMKNRVIEDTKKLRKMLTGK